MLDTTSTRLSANLRLAILATVVAVVLPLFASCAASPPYRTLLRTDAHCDERYQAARWNEGAAPKNSDTELARIQKLIRTDRKDTQVSGCWNTSYEHHATYDLYSVEFDDQGWLAHTSAGRVPDETQLTVLMNGVNALTRGRGAPDGRPLSVVIYTHGWHHSAAPDDENAVAFRRLLEEASTVERELCLAKRSGQPVAAESAPPEVCSENEAAPVWEKKRRRSEEHTSELQSRLHLVCRLLLEKKTDIRQHGLRCHPGRQDRPHVAAGRGPLRPRAHP